MKTEKEKQLAEAWRERGEGGEEEPNHKQGSLKMNTALEYSTRVVQEGAVDVKRVL